MEDARPASLNWRTLAVIALIGLVAWWVWTNQPKKMPDVVMQPNTPAPVAQVPGVPPTVVSKMARVADTQIPVVMTSGTAVQYGDDEIRQVIRQVLDRLNAMDEKMTLIQVASASKTVDSYKTVAYDIVASMYDSRENVGMLVAMSVLVPASGKLYVRSLKLHNSPSESNPGPPGAGENPRGGLAEYEDPVTVLRKMKVA